LRLTAEKAEALETPLPQVRKPPETAQSPFEVDIVKLETEPDRV
jgi:hypothetical protein